MEMTIGDFAQIIDEEVMMVALEIVENILEGARE